MITITVKNLQQQTFSIEFDPAKTVRALKELIYVQCGSEYIVDKQKLIYSGVILDDERTVASYNVDENKFIVLMLKREFGTPPKPDESGASASKSTTSIGSDNKMDTSDTKIDTPDTKLDTPATKLDARDTKLDTPDTKMDTSDNTQEVAVEKMDEKSASDEDTKSIGSGGSGGSGGAEGPSCSGLGTIGSTTSIKSTTSGKSLLSTGSGDSGGSESSHSTYSSGDLAGVFSVTSLQSRAESNLMVGDAYNRSVDSMVEMGYSRDLVERAMHASFNNPERAVEYLIGGIPEANEGFNAPLAAVEQAEQAVAEQLVAEQALAEQAFAEQALAEQAIPEPIIDLSGVVTGDNYDLPPGADPFIFLRNQPQFLHMRSLVYANPDLLHAVLQQIGQTNPALLQLISENQDAFLNMLNEPIEGLPSTAPIYPRRMTPGRRAQLAAAQRAAAGGDGPHVRALDTAPGAGGDGPPSRPPTGDAGDAGRGTIRHDLPPGPERGAERRAAAAAAFMRERAAAAAAVAALTAAASAAVDRDVGRGGAGGRPIRAADFAGDVAAVGRGVVAGAGRGGGDGRIGQGVGDGAGGEGLNVRPGAPPRSLPPTPHGAGADGDAATTFRLTAADRLAIQRLQALGFPEALVLQAYFACDRNEQLAANFLIASTADD